MTQKTIDDEKKIEIAEDYQKELAKSETNTVNKTAFGAKHGISPRSVNRILDQFGLRDNDTKAKSVSKAKAKPKTELSDKKKAALAKAKEAKKAKSEPKQDTEEVKKPEETESVDSGKTVTVKPVKDDPVMSFSFDRKRFITIMYESTDTSTIEPDHESYEEIKRKLIEGDYDNIKVLACRKTMREAIEQGNFKISSDGLYMNGSLVKNPVADEICELFQREEPFEHLLKFYQNLCLCPSAHIYKTLFNMIKNSHVQINEDGNIIAYRRVRSNFTDPRTGTMDNSVGTTLTIPYHEVDHNYNNTCSRGLHVCAPHYLNNSGYGGRGCPKVIKVEVEPRNCVAIPSDYRFTKMRVCSFKVIEDITEDFNAGKYKT